MSKKWIRLIILWPFSLLYQVITSLRNFLYDHRIGWYKPQRPDVKSIIVGNLTVGGTGKSPHIEYLIRLISNKYKTATLSRGYGRQTKGVVIAGMDSNARMIGDEPMQFYRKFAPAIKVVVGEQRMIAIPHLLSHHPETQVILLDDAYQHRPVLADLHILLTDYHRLFFKDYVLPSGNLRESRHGAKRADVIIITKCPDDIGYKKEYIKVKLRKYIKNSQIPVFFTGIRYGTPISIFDNNHTLNESSSIVCVVGLAQNNLFIDHCKQHYDLEQVLAYKDHHHYTTNDIECIVKGYDAIRSEYKCILTTEKDMVKWLTPEIKPLLEDLPVFYVPIEVYFHENESGFQKIVWEALK